MSEEDLHELKFPVGEFQVPKIYSEELISAWIKEIQVFPTHVKETSKGLTVEQLNWKYRPEGWCIKQVIHHCADSHMNSFIRFKLGLTEEQPTIKPYFEDKWAELVDSLDDNIEDSVNLISALHSKWSVLLKSIKEEELTKEFVHPEHGTKIALNENIAFYAWHCKHHLAHIKQALHYKGKFN